MVERVEDWQKEAEVQGKGMRSVGKWVEELWEMGEGVVGNGLRSCGKWVEELWKMV